VNAVREPNLNLTVNAGSDVQGIGHQPQPTETHDDEALQATLHVETNKVSFSAHIPSNEFQSHLPRLDGSL
jgi:hypothetical protein